MRDAEGGGEVIGAMLFYFSFSVLAFFPSFPFARGRKSGALHLHALPLLLSFSCSFSLCTPFHFTFLSQKGQWPFGWGFRLQFFPVNGSIRLSIFLCSSKSTNAMKKLFIRAFIILNLRAPGATA
ncbi:hypothetical protein F5H01DRAFT_346171 [Linnemannia elongata]|nr:hypothetical protein F5H01DRAFT_346171 [Linnemannia elongata]